MKDEMRADSLSFPQVEVLEKQVLNSIVREREDKVHSVSNQILAMFWFWAGSLSQFLYQYYIFPGTPAPPQLS